MNASREYTSFLAKFQTDFCNSTHTPCHFILKHGREFNTRAFPDHVAQMAEKACFMNAFHLALENGYQYCEGYAHAIIPTEHAWCVNAKGEVIDPTWDRDYKPDYFGVSFPLKLVIRIQRKTRVYGVFGDWTNWANVSKLLYEDFAGVSA